jgi:hypothetical protein
MLEAYTTTLSTAARVGTVEPEAIPARFVTTVHRGVERQPKPCLRQLNLLHQRAQASGRHRAPARALGRRGLEPERPLRTP